MGSRSPGSVGQLGKTIQRLRKAYNLSLSELAEQSGVAKSIISQIERNETNPTLATIWRLARRSTSRSSACLQSADEEPFIEKSTRGDTPILVSDDGKVPARHHRLDQDRRMAAMVRCSTPSPAACSNPMRTSAARSNASRCWTGEFEVEVGGVTRARRAGDTLRYRCDRPHVDPHASAEAGRATMVVHPQGRGDGLGPSPAVASLPQKDPRSIAERLSFWGGPVTAEPLGGGLTNANFLVRHRGERFVVRVGDDIPRHQVMRFNERAASLAAHAAGLSPQVVHHEPGALVFAFVEGEMLTPQTIREQETLARIAELIRRCHTK